MIKLEHVFKNFGKNEVLKDINLTVKEGEKLVIIGPSGSGKSTTVRCMNFLEEPTSGSVYINGIRLTRKNKVEVVRNTSAMVFQQFNLYPHMNVLHNLTLAPVKLHGVPRKEAEERAFHYLEIVGLSDKAHAYPSTLSGGQQQRVAIARALCSQAKIILFDEPTSGLDYRHMLEVSNCLKKLSAIGKTSLIITHDPELIAECCDYFIFIEDGTVKWYGPFDTQNGQRVQQFFGSEEGGAL